MHERFHQAALGSILRSAKSADTCPILESLIEDPWQA